MSDAANTLPSHSAEKPARSGSPEESDVALRSSRGASARDRRLRAHRIDVDGLGLVEVRAMARHPGGGSLEGRVEDLSFHGVAFALERGLDRDPLVLVGARLERLRIEAEARVIYTGAGTIRRVEEREHSLLLGVELETRGVALGELYRMGSKRGFAARLETCQSQAALVSREFTAWVAELEGFLQATRTFCDAEERALDGLDRWSREQALADYLDAVAPGLVRRLNDAATELEGLVKGLDEEGHALHRAHYRARLLGYLRESPFLRRAHDKPLGYAGDYEMMNMLYRSHAEGDSLFARALNRWAAQEPAARANINRLEFLGTKIRVALQAPREGRLRIASIGSGPAREITRLLEQSPELGERIDVALIDQDARAIAFGQRTLGALAAETGARVQFIDGSIRRLLTSRSLLDALGPRDFVYSAGLFDYLTDRSFAALLGALHQVVAPGGQLCVGNVASHNSSRWFMEYGLDWFLVHRSREELLAFGEALEPAPHRMTVESEPLGVNLFLTLER